MGGQNTLRPPHFKKWGGTCPPVHPMIDAHVFGYCPLSSALLNSRVMNGASRLLYSFTTHVGTGSSWLALFGASLKSLMWWLHRTEFESKIQEIQLQCYHFYYIIIINISILIFWPSVLPSQGSLKSTKQYKGEYDRAVSGPANCHATKQH